jgi:hypothetical protein
LSQRIHQLSLKATQQLIECPKLGIVRDEIPERCPFLVSQETAKQFKEDDSIVRRQRDLNRNASAIVALYHARRPPR